MRRIDPLEAMLRITSHPTYNADLHPKLLDQGDVEATRITCQAVKDVFGVADYDPAKNTGLTVAEQLALLGAFSLYIDGLKKSIEPTPTSAGSTEGPTSPESNDAITSVTSASG
jgi:hypothetical protein